MTTPGDGMADNIAQRDRSSSRGLVAAMAAIGAALVILTFPQWSLLLV